MDTFKDIVYSLVLQLSEERQLSLLRIVKALYLFDWSSVLNLRAERARFKWSCGMCGPICEQISVAIQNDNKAFYVFTVNNHQGGKKVMVRCIDMDYSPTLSVPCQKAINHVVRTIKGMSWDELALLVSSTMPVVMSTMGEPLNLKLAAEERRKTLPNK